jgi:hypothetical protein
VNNYGIKSKIVERTLLSGSAAGYEWMTFWQSAFHGIRRHNSLAGKCLTASKFLLFSEFCRFQSLSAGKFPLLFAPARVPRGQRGSTLI